MRSGVVKNDLHSTNSHSYSEAIFKCPPARDFLRPEARGLDRQTLRTF